MAKTQNILRGQDEAIWRAARPHLDVRSNDAHTLYAYTLAQKLLDFYPEGNTHIVLPAILLHDTGRRKASEKCILRDVSPDNISKQRRSYAPQKKQLYWHCYKQFQP